MSDWQRVIDNCEMAGLDAPNDMFEVSECIDKLDDQIRKLKRENQKLKEQQANGDNTSDSGLHLQRVSGRSEQLGCPKCGSDMTGDGTKSWCKSSKCDFIEAD